MPLILPVSGFIKSRSQGVVHKDDLLMFIQDHQKAENAFQHFPDNRHILKIAALCFDLVCSCPFCRRKRSGGYTCCMLISLNIVIG